MLQGERMQAMEAAARSIEEPMVWSTGCDSGRFCTMSDQVEGPASSRWSVYLDQKPVEEVSEDEGEGGEIVYMDRQHFQAGVRNASRDRSLRKRKRGLHSDSEHLHTYGNCTDSDAKESSQQKMKSYLKCMNSTPSESRNRNAETADAERSNILNWSQLEPKPAAGLRDERQPATATFSARSQGSRWDRFLPHNAENNELFNPDSSGAERHPAWKRDSPCTDQPSARFVFKDQGEYIDGSSLSAGLAFASNGCPGSPLITGSVSVTEGIVTQTHTSLELVEGTKTMPGLPELHEASSGVCVAEGIPPHDPISTSTRGAPGVLHSLKSGSSLTSLSLTAHQSSAYGMPSTASRLHAKPSSFLSLFQTDEDFDDLCDK
ncbi:MRN complex-interacting protein isoform X2 [Mustelus asterias]